jgi:hypothetical protein
MQQYVQLKARKFRFGLCVVHNPYNANDPLQEICTKAHRDSVFVENQQIPTYSAIR